MNPQAESLLHSVSAAAKTQFRTLEDRQSLYRLALHLHRYALHMSGAMLSVQLIAHGVSQPEADRVAAEVDHYRELLALYDRERI